MRDRYYYVSFFIVMALQRPVQFKMVLLGESAVGKSSLALRFAKGQYHEHAESTIGAAFLTHTLQIDSDTSVKVELWDTAGQERSLFALYFAFERTISSFRYHALAPMYYRGAQAALVVYDVTNSDSLRRAKMWVKELRQASTKDIVIGLAGNKADLGSTTKRQVDTREASEYADENGLIFMETSAKRGDNVTEIFLAIARQVASTHQNNKPNGGFSVQQKSKKASSGGCCGGDSKS